MYFNKKEEQKATKEQNKEFRKRAREERKAGKELKEKVGKRTCKTNVNLQNDERVDWNCYADFIYDNKKVSFGDVRAMYSIDKASKTGKALPKLSDKHMNPNNFQKMNVQLVVQVLSRSVSASIRTAKETGERNTATAYNTANFIELINDTFDILNSRVLNSKRKYCKALSVANLDGMQIMQSTCNIMKIIKKIDRNGRTRRPPYFEGLQMIISG
ncbi:hypothetical protein QE152_g38041 [Popillia japonica]|uniref:Transposable element P transposase-like GTP-binding insertion domain-containing protein n=1 Tax=Popillia japonica TaxID=7064 RepID=A0AAW1I958_POPJA